MGKPIAAVVLEGTVVTHVDDALCSMGDWLPDAPTKMEALQKTHTILIVSALAKTNAGVRLIQSRLYADDVPFDEIWMGCGLPPCSRFVCNTAEAL